MVRLSPNKPPGAIRIELPEIPFKKYCIFEFFGKSGSRDCRVRSLKSQFLRYPQHMNILSIAGLALAVYCIWWTLIDISSGAGVDPSVYWSPASAMTVIGGSFGATMLKSSMADFKAGWLLLPQAFKNGVKPTALIEQLIDFAGIARKNGLIALESQEIKDTFLNKAVQQLVDGSKPDVMQRRFNQNQTHNSLGKNTESRCGLTWEKCSQPWGWWAPLLAWLLYCLTCKIWHL